MSSLYDNIPHEVGLETAKIKKYIYKDQEAKLPIDFVINPVTSVFDKKKNVLFTDSRYSNGNSIINKLCFNIMLYAWSYVL